MQGQPLRRAWQEFWHLVAFVNVIESNWDMSSASRFIVSFQETLWWLKARNFHFQQTNVACPRWRDSSIKEILYICYLVIMCSLRNGWIESVFCNLSIYARRWPCRFFTFSSEKVLDLCKMWRPPAVFVKCPRFETLWTRKNGFRECLSVWL